jgi:6-phospho-beta-glucosidase
MKGVAIRLAVLGGSGASTPELVDALTGWAPDRRPPFTIVLHGRSAEKLRLVAGACRSRAPRKGAVRVEATTDIDSALEGAEVVLHQVRVGGLAARVFDETFPRAHGLPGEETMGPGGFANAVRTVPTVRATFERITSRAPRALVINLTNPSGIVTAAGLRAAPGSSIVSVCDAPLTFTAAVAERLGRPVDEVRRGYLGLNHLGFWTTPRAADLDRLEGVAAGIELLDARVFGALPAPYGRFYLHPERQLEAQLAAGESRAQVLQRLEAEMLGQYAAQTPSTKQTRRGAVWYRESVVPLLAALLEGSAAPLILGLPNAGSVDGLPNEVILERAFAVRDGQLDPLELPVISPAAHGLLARQALYETLTLDALADAPPDRVPIERRDALVRALAANPMVPSIDRAAGLVDAILAADIR